MKKQAKNFKEIEELVKKISKKLKDAKNKFRCIGLIGDLGTGKTTIAKSICKELGVKENVKSPTFTYVIEYKTPDVDIYHFDVYRLTEVDELYEIGFEDYINTNAVMLVEWANNVYEAMPDNTLYIELEYLDIESRLVSIYKLKDGEKEYVDICNYDFD